MEPFYMNMHSSPHQDQAHYRPRCYSSMEARPPMSYGCWPWGANYGYLNPGACHGCANHAYMPSHCAWGSPYPHVPPHYYPGNYPYLPVHYMPPPPYNVMEHPRYEYEKNVRKEDHCCGCSSHHSPHQKQQRNVRIEEEEPEKERRKNDSLVPLQFTNLPYPIVWFPSDCKEQGKVKAMDRSTDDSRDLKMRKDVVSSKEMGDEKEKEEYCKDNRKQNSQFPLLWIPYKPDDMERDSHKVKDVTAKASLESEKGLDCEQKLTAPRAKEIPVKEVEQQVGEENSKVHGKERDNSVGSQRKPSSPPKSSKLPPVCLRVDPLPRKKSVNAKSRSPSPPGDKQKLEVKSNEASKEQVTEDKGTKIIAAVNESASLKPQNDDSVKQVEESAEVEYTAQKQTECDAVIASPKGENEEALTAEGVKKDDVKKCRELSEEEAAVIIQSAYRRFDVCRWEPIKKLKQIARVREQIADVKRLVQEFELSSDIHDFAKKKNIIAETIMSLLLKLDMIQGLHPSIREIRKSVVRELVDLQEQLDTLLKDKHEDVVEQKPIMRCDHEDDSNKREVVMLSEDGNEVAVQNQVDGGANFEVRELSEAKMIEEAASAKTEMEAEESSVDEGVKSAQYGTTEDKSMNSSESLECNENQIIEHGSELSDLGPTDLAELPQGVVDDLCEEEQEEVTNHTAPEVGSDNDDQSMQAEEALMGPPIVVESYCEVANEEKDQTMETDEASDIPVSGVEMGRKETEILDTCNMANKLEEEDTVTRDAISDERNEGRATDTTEHSDEREVSPAEVCILKLNEKLGLEDAYERKEKISNGDESNIRVMEENERLRDAMEKLMKSGEEQLKAISVLSGRVKDMEKQLSRKRKVKVKRSKLPRSSS